MGDMGEKKSEGLYSRNKNSPILTWTGSNLGSLGLPGMPRNRLRIWRVGSWPQTLALAEHGHLKLISLFSGTKVLYDTSERLPGQCKI